MRTPVGHDLYRRLPYAVFAFITVAFALHPFSPFRTHHLADPDDYMRLNEVIAWLRGQGWYDLSVPRMSPGANTTVHWSRLIDLPIAAVTALFTARFGVTDAAMIAALIVPLLWLAVFLATVTRLDARLNRRRTGLATVFLLFAPLLLFDFTSGRVDHHGAQAVIALFGLTCLDGIVANDRHARRCAILAAVAFACGFWIGAEALPWAALFIACAGIAAAWTGGRVAHNFALFGLALPLATLAVLPLALPIGAWSSRALSWFSPAYAIFAALAGGILVLGAVLTRRCERRNLRLAVYAALALVAAVTFFVIEPSARAGIFADYDSFDATTALDNITEAQPLTASLPVNRFMPATIMATGLFALRWLALPLAALAFALWRGRRDRRWLIQAAFLTAALLLTVFWQRRVGIFMQAFMLVPLAGLMGALWSLLGSIWHQPWQARRRVWAEAALFLALGPVPVILLPALVRAQPLGPDLLLFPAARGAAACDLTRAIDALNDRSRFPHAITLMNTSDSGPQILYGTRHRVVAGNFDVPGNADARTFFAATDDAQARAAARRWHADYVLLCRTMPTLYLGHEYYAPGHVTLRPAADGLLHLTNTDAMQPLIARLTRETPPRWLAPVEIPGGSDYVLYKILDTPSLVPGAS